MIYREISDFDVPLHGGDPSGLFGTDIVRMPKRPATVGLDDGSLPAQTPAAPTTVITASTLPLVTSSAAAAGATNGSASGTTANAAASVPADGSAVPALTAVSPIGGLTWGTLIIYAVLAYVVWEWIR